MRRMITSKQAEALENLDKNIQFNEDDVTITVPYESEDDETYFVLGDPEEESTPGIYFNDNALGYGFNLGVYDNENERYNKLITLSTSGDGVQINKLITTPSRSTVSATVSSGTAVIAGSSLPNDYKKLLINNLILNTNTETYILTDVQFPPYYSIITGENSGTVRILQIAKNSLTKNLIFQLKKLDGDDDPITSVGDPFTVDAYTYY